LRFRLFAALSLRSAALTSALREVLGRVLRLAGAPIAPGAKDGASLAGKESSL
jgi:hypothetical protein